MHNRIRVGHHEEGECGCSETMYYIFFGCVEFPAGKSIVVPLSIGMASESKASTAQKGDPVISSAKIFDKVSQFRRTGRKSTVVRDRTVNLNWVHRVGPSYQII